MDTPVYQNKILDPAGTGWKYEYIVGTSFWHHTEPKRGKYSKWTSTEFYDRYAHRYDPPYPTSISSHQSLWWGGTTAASHGLHANAYYEYLIYSPGVDCKLSPPMLTYAIPMTSRRYGAGASGGASVSYIGAANFAAGVALVAAIEEAGSLDSKIVSETLKKLEIDEFYNLDFRTSNGSHQNGVRRQILTHHRLFHRHFFLV